MKVKRMIKSDVDTFKVGDIIKVKLTDGVKVQATIASRANITGRTFSTYYGNRLYSLRKCLAAHITAFRVLFKFHYIDLLI